MQINYVISTVMEQADNQIMQFDKYTKYLNYDFESDIILAIKKNLYDAHLLAMMQEAGSGVNSMDGSEDEASNKNYSDDEEGDGLGGSGAYSAWRKMTIDEATYERNF